LDAGIAPTSALDAIDRRAAIEPIAPAITPDL
jgi:hypothetical protein